LGVSVVPVIVADISGMHIV